MGRGTMAKTSQPRETDQPRRMVKNPRVKNPRATMTKTSQPEAKARSQPRMVNPSQRRLRPPRRVKSPPRTDPPRETDQPRMVNPPRRETMRTSQEDTESASLKPPVNSPTSSTSPKETSKTLRLPSRRETGKPSKRVPTSSVTRTPRDSSTSSTVPNLTSKPMRPNSMVRDQPRTERDPPRKSDFNYLTYQCLDGVPNA